jgi:DNA-binding protein H-NS
MAQTYLQIQRQIETLQRQAEKLKSQEVDGVVARIKVAIAHYGLTAEQLGLGGGATKPGKAKKQAIAPSPKVPSAPKYADGRGNVWSGRGPRPRWLREALAAGKSLESFASTGEPTTTRKRKSKPAGKRTAQQYRDDSGNAWSGFGPQPRWLKDALASGGTLAQFAVGHDAQT